MQQKKHVYTLKATERLKHRKKIDVLFTEGHKFSLGEIRVVYHLSKAEDEASLLLGVGVSKRYFKKAVDRNLIKRRLREAMRLSRPDFLPFVKEAGNNLDLFILYTAKEIPCFDHCMKLVQGAFKKLTGKLKHKKDA